MKKEKSYTEQYLNHSQYTITQSRLLPWPQRHLTCFTELLIFRFIALAAQLWWLLSSVSSFLGKHNWKLNSMELNLKYQLSFKFWFQIGNQGSMGIHLPLLMNRPTYILCTLIDKLLFIYFLNYANIYAQEIILKLLLLYS